MKPLDFSILADENIDRAVVSALRSEGKDIETVLEIGLGGVSDAEVMRYAHTDGRVVLTHDRDFGLLARHSDVP